MGARERGEGREGLQTFTVGVEVRVESCGSLACGQELHKGRPVGVELGAEDVESRENIQWVSLQI